MQSRASTTIAPTPTVDGIHGMVPGALGDAVWVGRDDEGVLVRAIVVDDPRLPSDLGDRLTHRAPTLIAVGQHSGAVVVRAVGAGADGYLTVTTEHHPLGTLDRALDAGPARWDEVASIGVQVAETLANAHRHRVLHGRVAPSAIHLGSDRRVRLGGFAEIGELEHRLELTASHLPYVAPERAATSAADVYSLAATLLAAGTGLNPGTAPDLARVPVPMRFVLAQALAGDPTQRPSAADLAELLRAVVHGDDPSEALRRQQHSGPAIDLVDEDADEEDDNARPRRTKAARRPGRWRGRLVKLLVMLALAVGALIAGSVLSRFTGNDPALDPGSVSTTEPTEPATTVGEPVAVVPVAEVTAVAPAADVSVAPLDVVVPTTTALSDLPAYNLDGSEVVPPAEAGVIPPIVLDPDLLTSTTVD